MMSNVSITLSQRGSIYAYLQDGLSFGQIALRLHHSKSVIWNEIHRLKHYNHDKAQADEERERSHCSRHSILNGYTESTIYNELKLNYPPELIARGLNVATSSIYNWIYRHWINGINLSLLPEKGIRRKRKKDRRGRFPKSFALAMKTFMRHFKSYVKSITISHGRESSVIIFEL